MKAIVCVRVLILALGLFCPLMGLRAQTPGNSGSPPDGPSYGNPTGTAGQFNGNVLAGGSYDPLTGNATRSVADLTVPGSVGAYPLTFARTTNSRLMGGVTTFFGDGGNWRHNYQYELAYTFNTWSGNGQLVAHYPDGREVLFVSLPANDPRYGAYHADPRVQANQVNLLYGPLGTSDRLDNTNPLQPVLLMADGGKVIFETYTQAGDGTPSFRPKFIVDPHGQRTTLAYWVGVGLQSVTEPGGRWLRVDYLPELARL